MSDLDSKYKVEDVSAFVVMQGEHGMCVGYCVELGKGRWAAVCTSTERYLVGVYDDHRKAYQAVCAAEEANTS